MAQRGSVRVGCSGYEYDDWRDRFYPPRLPKARWLEHYASHFDTVEINSTFYGLPSAATIARWGDQVPPAFRFAVKLSGFGTHRKHLLEPERWLPVFVERVRGLGARLGPILAQLPPHWHADPARLDRFLSVAPADLRWAIEVRDPAWLHEEVYDVLRTYDAALVQHDLLARHPRVVTASWGYLRFHGPDPGRPYAGGYSPQALSGAARRITAMRDDGLDVYAYFNNDIGAWAPVDAARLRRFVSDATRKAL